MEFLALFCFLHICLFTSYYQKRIFSALLRMRTSLTVMSSENWSSVINFLVAAGNTTCGSSPAYESGWIRFQPLTSFKNLGIIWWKSEKPKTMSLMLQNGSTSTPSLYFYTSNYLAQLIYLVLFVHILYNFQWIHNGLGTWHCLCLTDMWQWLHNK